MFANAKPRQTHLSNFINYNVPFIVTQHHGIYLQPLNVFMVPSLTSILPNKLNSSSEAGHSGLFTVDNRSCTKFSNKGL